MGNSKDWDDIPYVTNDCIRDVDEWNDMVDYIRHSACTDFIIYSTCPDTGQAFRFTQDGTESHMYGGEDSGDDLHIWGNDNALAVNIALLNSGEFQIFDGATQFLEVQLNGTITEILGGVLATDDISIQPNSAVGAPKLLMYGNSDSYYDIPTGSKFHWRSGFTTFLDLYESGTEDTVEGKTAGNDLTFKSASGLLKWGTEQTNAGSDRGELVPFKTLAGDTVYLKTYNLA